MGDATESRTEALLKEIRDLLQQIYDEGRADAKRADEWRTESTAKEDQALEQARASQRKALAGQSRYMRFFVVVIVALIPVLVFAVWLLSMLWHRVA